MVGHSRALVNYKGVLLTADTRDMVQALEKRVFDLGKWKLELTGPSPGAVLFGEGQFSLAPAGREVRIQLRRSDRSEQDRLNAMWAAAVPLGFTPHDRWPRISDTGHIFYYFGLWQSIHDRLLAEGRGHLAWPSVCTAAQVDVGVWRGDRETERFVQAHLHRIGRNVGPLDGVIGKRTLAAIETLGLNRPSLAQVYAHLQTREVEPPKNSVKQPTQGHITVPGHTIQVQAFGDVTAQQHGLNAAFLTAHGEGRFVVDVKKP